MKTFDVGFSPDIIKLVARLFVYVKDFQPMANTAKKIGNEFEDRWERHLPPGFEIISRRGEFRFGRDISSYSGLKHEEDKILKRHNDTIVIEFKHAIIQEAVKIPFLVFWAKTLDYQLRLIQLDFRDKLYSMFVTCEPQIADDIRAFCYMWGIILVDPTLRPPEVLFTMLRELDDRLRKARVGEKTRRDEIRPLMKRAGALILQARKGIGEILYRDITSGSFATVDFRKLGNSLDAMGLLREQKQIDSTVSDLKDRFRRDI